MVKQLTIETAGPGLREITREVQPPGGRREVVLHITA
jgi:hypothetical protein